MSMSPLPDDILRLLLSMLIELDYNRAFDMLAYCTSRNEDLRSWAMAQPRPMIFAVLLTTSTGLCVRLRSYDPTGVNINVDWGDGTPLQLVSASSETKQRPPLASHRYTSYGLYTIRVYPNAPHGKASLLAFNGVFGASGIVVLRAVKTFGNLGIRDISWLFTNCTDTDIRGLDVSRIEDMSGLFLNSTIKDSIADWDVSNVTDMANMFDGAREFDQPIGNWNVSNVTDMSHMFAYAHAFNQPIGQWDVSKVTNMAYMFTEAENFNQPIGQWDVSKVTNMASMFESAHAFNQPIGQWDVSKVTDMSAMFARACNFNQPIGKWDVSKVEDMTRMFFKAFAFDQSMREWNISDGCATTSMILFSGLLPEDTSVAGATET